jgi:CBS domain-containing protein
MTESLAVCHVGDMVSVAAKLMWEHDCGVMPVLDKGLVVAMLTDRDICMAAFTQGKPLSEIEVSVAMSKALVVCHPEDTIEQAERLMSKHQIRRLPVVNQQGQPVGVLSLSDLARAAAHAPSAAIGNPTGTQLTATAKTLAAVCSVRTSSSGMKGT